MYVTVLGWKISRASTKTFPPPPTSINTIQDDNATTTSIINTCLSSLDCCWTSTASLELASTLHGAAEQSLVGWIARWS